MKAGEYIKKVGMGYTHVRDNKITKFTFKELRKFSPKNRFAFLKNYYGWIYKEYNYSGHLVKRKHIPNSFFDQRRVYLSINEVKNLLFSLTFSRKQNNQEVLEFIGDYKNLLDELRKTAKRYIKIKNKIVKAGAWK